MSHIIGENAGKKINTISELFINDITFVSFKCTQTIRWNGTHKGVSSNLGAADATYVRLWHSRMIDRLN